MLHDSKNKDQAPSITLIAALTSTLWDKARIDWVDYHNHQKRPMQSEIDFAGCSCYAE